MQEKNTRNEADKKGLFKIRLFDWVLIAIVFSLITTLIILTIYNYLKFPPLQDTQTLNVALTIALVTFGAIEAISTASHVITEKKGRQTSGLRNALEKFYSPVLLMLNNIVYIEEGTAVLSQNDKQTLDETFSKEPFVLNAQEMWQNKYHRQEIPDIDSYFVKSFNAEYESKKIKEEIEKRFFSVYSLVKNAHQNIEKVVILSPNEKKMIDSKFLAYPYMVSQELYDHWDSKIRHLKPTVENLMRHEIELQANLKIPNTCSNDEFGCYLIPEAFISELFREYNKKISEYRKPATAF